MTQRLLRQMTEVRSRVQLQAVRSGWRIGWYTLAELSWQTMSTAEASQCQWFALPAQSQAPYSHPIDRAAGSLRRRPELGYTVVEAWLLFSISAAICGGTWALWCSASSS